MGWRAERTALLNHGCNHRQRPRGLCCTSTSPPRPSQGPGRGSSRWGSGSWAIWRRGQAHGACVHTAVPRERGACARVAPGARVRPSRPVHTTLGALEHYARPVRLTVEGSSGPAVGPAGSFHGQIGAPVFEGGPRNVHRRALPSGCAAAPFWSEVGTLSPNLAQR